MENTNEQKGYQTQAKDQRSDMQRKKDMRKSRWGGHGKDVSKPSRSINLGRAYPMMDSSESKKTQDGRGDMLSLKEEVVRYQHEGNPNHLSDTMHIKKNGDVNGGASDQCDLSARLKDQSSEGKAPWEDGVIPGSVTKDEGTKIDHFFDANGNVNMDKIDPEFFKPTYDQNDQSRFLGDVVLEAPVDRNTQFGHGVNDHGKTSVSPSSSELGFDNAAKDIKKNLEHKYSGYDGALAEDIRKVIRQEAILSYLADDIDVSVENGIVTLSGNVATEQQRMVCVDKAVSFVGFGRVNNNLCVLFDA